MKPLSEWTDDELRHCLIYDTDLDHGPLESVLAELLRCDRERCAAECDTVAIEAESGADYEGSHWAYECGKRIRALP